MTERRRYDPERALRVERFFERVCKHTKGKWARRPFLLTDWQRDDIIRPLFGTVRWDDQHGQYVRQYRIGWIELGRGNGKSEKLAAVGLYLVGWDGEEGAEVYGCARDREQAGHVFRVAARMVELSPALAARLTVIESRKTIVDYKTGSFYRVIAADAAGNLGQNPHGILFDEVISQPSRDLWDALKTGFGKRIQPLMLAATTAGNDPESFAAQEHEYCAQIARDPDLDPARFVYMRNTPDTADAWDEETWKIANPALGDFLSIEQLRDEAREAHNDPTYEDAFRQYRLNQWRQQVTRWMPLNLWDRCGGMIAEEERVSAVVYGGLDLAATTDLAALAWWLPETKEAVFRFWTPEAMLPVLDKHLGGRASVWARQGLLKVTEGDAIDYDVIHRQIARDAETFDVREIALDRWNSQATASWLDQQGIETVLMAPGYALSSGLKELMRLVKTQGINHGGHPVMRWNIDSVEVRRNDEEKLKAVKPKREASGNRIDGVVALAMAIDRWSIAELEIQPTATWL